MKRSEPDDKNTLWIKEKVISLFVQASLGLSHFAVSIHTYEGFRWLRKRPIFIGWQGQDKSVPFFSLYGFQSHGIYYEAVKHQMKQNSPFLLFPAKFSAISASSWDSLLDMSEELEHAFA